MDFLTSQLSLGLNCAPCQSTDWQSHHGNNYRYMSSLCSLSDFILNNGFSCDDGDAFWCPDGDFGSAYYTDPAESRDD